MAPEQARDAHAADIRCRHLQPGLRAVPPLAGQPPFPDTNIISQMIRHATETPRPLKEFNPAVPDGLQQIVNWMMAKDPAQRYPTPERAAQALQVFLAAGTEPLRTPESDPKTKLYLTYLEKTGNDPVEAPLEAQEHEEALKPLPPLPAALPAVAVRSLTTTLRFPWASW